MKIALVIPRNNSKNSRSFYDYNFYSSFLFSRKYISYLLAIPTLASLTPSHHEIRVFDENIEKIDYSWKVDLVGISVRTMFANRAYAISQKYKELGIKTVLGGIHPSMCPDEALNHCDSIVIGEAENVWAGLLKDAEEGHLKQIYKSVSYSDLSQPPAVYRNNLSRNMYLQDIIQTTKGCPFHCEFCSVYIFDGQKNRHKSIDQIIQEISDINSTRSKYKSKKAIFIADDNIISNRKFAVELFQAMKPHNINWMCQASIDISREDELLALMRDSGCGAIFIGLESISGDNLKAMHKDVNQRFDYVRAIRKIQSYGMLVHGSFIVGYDHDSEKTYNELIAFIEKTKLLMPLINILTPFPGTELFNRLEEEGRILHKDWNKYDTKNVVFSPRYQTINELAAGYRKIVQEVYSFGSIWKKLNYYWDTDFWKRSNELDPVKFIYRIFFALRLGIMLFSRNIERSWFIVKLLPKIFNKRVRISSVLTLMAYNDFAFHLEAAQE